MAIPPIISNNPLLKLFRTDQQGGEKNEKPANTAATPSDIVEISETAQKRLDGIKQLSAEDPAEVQQVAGETRDILTENQISLGRGTVA